MCAYTVYMHYPCTNQFYIIFHLPTLPHLYTAIIPQNNSQFLDTYSRYLSSFRSVSNSRNSSPLSCSALQQSTTTATIDPAVSKYMRFMYDAVWSMALALNRAEMNLTTNFALSLANFSYNNTVITDAIFSAMMATNFSGASVSVCVCLCVCVCVFVCVCVCVCAEQCIVQRVVSV